MCLHVCIDLHVFPAYTEGGQWLSEAGGTLFFLREMGGLLFRIREAGGNLQKSHKEGVFPGFSNDS